MEKQEMNKIWFDSFGQKHTKKLIIKLSAIIATEILRCPRQKIQSIMESWLGTIISENIFIGLSTRPHMQEKCNKNEEMAHYIIHECDTLVLTRLTTLGIFNTIELA